MQRRFLLVTLVACLASTWACSDNTNPSGGGASSSSGDNGSSSGGSSGESSSGETTSSSGGGSSGASSSGEPVGCPGDGAVSLRVVAGNLTGEPQEYDQTGVRIFKGLAADIALVQEMNFGANQEADARSFVDQAFGSDFGFVRGDITSNGDIPNGVVSRYPILASGSIEDPEVNNGTFVWARIDVPVDRDVLAFSVLLLTDNSRRDDEARALVEAIRSVRVDNDLLLLGGDFNTDARNDNGVSEIAEEFVTSGPYPVDEDDVDGTNNSRARPYDWVVADETLHGQATTTRYGGLEFANGLVFDSRVFSDLSLVAPVETDDSETHQHMAVVRTFELWQ